MIVFGHQPSASTQQMAGAGQTCRAIKAENPEQKILIAGGHVAALPERRMQHTGYFPVRASLAGLRTAAGADAMGVPRDSRNPAWTWKGRVDRVCGVGWNCVRSTEAKIAFEQR